MTATLTIALDSVVNTLLACVRTALAASEPGEPERACAVAGELAWDDCQCGQLGLTVDRIYLSRTFPIEATGPELVSPCPPAYLAANLTVTVLRCAPVPQGRAVAPTCAALDEAAQTWFTDLDTVASAVTCCLIDLREATTIEEYIVGDQLSVGPEGGCVGSDSHLTVGLRNCLCATE